MSSAQTGLGHFLRALIQRLFGNSNGTPTTAGDTTAAWSADADDVADGPFVVAPGGYRIHIPQSSDVSHSVGDMLPSVREGLSVLPPLPQVVIDLLREIQDPKSTAASVAHIASSDPALAASLIRTVNAAALGLSRKISSVGDAVSYLGFGAVKAMVVRLRLDQVLAPKNPVAAVNAEDMWVHSLAVSYAAEYLARRVPGVDSGFAATLGLLHDIGSSRSSRNFREQAASIQTAPSEDLLAYEAHLLGVDHAGVGADLAAKWNLPADLMQAIRFHHSPSQAFHESDPLPLRQAVYVVHIANQLVKYCFAHADHIVISPVSDDAFALLGLEPSLAKLLDDKMRTTIGRAILFADANTKRDPSMPRRFLRLLSGDAAARAVTTHDQNTPRVTEDGAAIDALFAAGSDAEHVQLSTPATAAGIAKCIGKMRVQLSELDLPAEIKSSASLVIAALLPNLLPISTESDTVEVAQYTQDRRVTLSIRCPSLATARRLTDATTPNAARRLAEAELAHLLNLGWFERITITPDGAAMMFESK